MGLVKLLYRDHRDIILPEYLHFDTDIEGQKAADEIKDKKNKDWIKSEIPKLYDVILFNIMGYPIHMGMILDNKYMLHTLKGHNSCIESFTSTKWNRRIEGFYRWPYM